jgi:hypothetical protein
MRRLVWLSLGFASGLSLSWWLLRTTRKLKGALSTDDLALRARGTLGRARRELADAVAEGREAMRAREAELRADLARRAEPRRTASEEGSR